jgi:hypothetical protein
MPHRAYAPVPLAALTRALSAERLGAYSLDTDRDSTDAIARYLWNVALCSAALPALHVLEVALRNEMYAASLEILRGRPLRFHEVPCWLDANPSLLERREADAVEEAKRLLRRNPRHLTPGRLVAKLHLGFWMNLCNRPYEHGRVGGPRLWPRMAKLVFPHCPRSQREREQIRARLDSIRTFRNRIAHHDPVWDSRFIERYQEILEAIGWMNPPVRQAVERTDRVRAVFRLGPNSFRARADAIVR